LRCDKEGNKIKKMKSTVLLLLFISFLSSHSYVWASGKSRQKFQSQKSKSINIKTKKTQSPKPNNEKSAGIWGYTMVKNLPPTPETSLAENLDDCEVIILAAKDLREIKRLRSDKTGRFTVTLQPGKYIIYPHISKIEVWVAMESKVTVRRGVLTEVEAWYDALW
jgi:hypothetical protein